MKNIKFVHIEHHEINQTSPIQPTSTTLTQWGKAAFAFTVATGIYAISKTIGGVWGSEPTSQMSTVEQNNLPVAAIPEAFHLIDGDAHWDYPDSPLLTFSALALSAPYYPLTFLSTLGFLLIQQLDVTQAAFPAAIDLANLSPSQGCGMLGAAAGDETGFSVSHVGDVNGDGLDDVLVGAWYADPLGRTDAGVAYLFFGRNGSWPAILDLANLTAAEGVVLQGAAADDRTGVSVSHAGDVNGDGLDDVLVGAYIADPYPNRRQAGVTYLLFGRSGSWPATLDLASLTSTEGVVLQGAAANDRTGISVSHTGDVNGDGLDDVLVGAYLTDVMGRSDAGSAILLFGRNGSWPATLDLANLNANDGVVLQGAAAGDETGFSVSHAGDVNGDEMDDVLVGAYQADPLGRTLAGSVILLFGRTGSWPATLDLGNLTAAEGVVLQGAAVGDETGVSVSHAGDVNGDGLDDVLVGAYLAAPLGRNLAGVAYLLFGRNGSWPATLDLANLTATEGVVLQGAAANDRTGVSVSRAGDVNGDGLDDVLVGAWYADPLGRSNAGSAILLFGRTGSWPATLDLANLNVNEGVVLQGAAADDRTGYSVSHAGDVNGDGLTDLLVGAYEANPLNRTDAGTATLIFGQRANPLTLPNTPSIPAASSLAGATASATSSSTPSSSASNPASLPSMFSSPTPTPMPTNAIPSSTSPSTGVITPRPVSGFLTSGNPVTSFNTQATPMGSSAQDIDSASLTSQALSSTPADSSNQIISGFTVVTNSVLYAEIGIEVIITTDNLSVEGFTGDPNQLIFTLPNNPAYTVTVNGEEQNSFPLWAIQQGFVGLTLGNEFCFEDFNEIPVQATDGSSNVDFNLVFQADTASCIFSDASTLNVRPSLQGAALLLVSSGLGLLASKRQDKSKSTETESKLLTNNCDDTVEMKLSK